MKHAIILSATDLRVTVAACVKAIRAAKAHPTAEFRHGLTTWWPCTGAAVMQQFREGCHDRQAARAALVAQAQPWQLPRHQRYLVRFEREVDRRYRWLLRPELREDANPRICGDAADAERRVTRWNARKVTQRAMRYARRTRRAA